jgi:hypothetical protein
MQPELPKQFSNLFGSAAARATAPEPEPETVEETTLAEQVAESVPDVRRVPAPVRKLKKVRPKHRELKLVLPESVVRELKVHASKGLTTSSEVVLAALRQYIPAVREVLKKAA